MKKKPLFLFMMMIFISCVVTNCKNGEHKSIGNNNDFDQTTVNNPQEILNSSSADLNIYDVGFYERKELTDAFVSVSDIYHDSLSISPDYFENQEKVSFDDRVYIELDGDYRKKMLTALQLTESDTLYLFNYASASVQKIPLLKLKSVAYLSYYVGKEDNIDENSYMLGFQIENQKKWENIYQKYEHSIAYFGSNNPFVENQLVPVRWKKIQATALTNKLFKNSNNKSGSLYEFKNAKLTYYLQDFSSEENNILRNLVVVDDAKKIFFEQSFDTNFDGREFTALSGTTTEGDHEIHSQWTGYLFRNKPPVIFGFTSESFGCSSISFMDKKLPELFVNCDNRH